MSNKVENFSALDSMPTDYLKTLLSLDIENSGVELGAETVQHILEVIQSRDAEAGAAQSIDTAAAWDDFNAHYRPEPESGSTSLIGAPKCVAASAKKHIRLKRFVVTVAAIVAIFAACTAVAGAAGIDLWGTIVQWAQETFGLKNNGWYDDSSVPSSGPVCKDLQEMLDVHGIDDKVVPTWLPDGFKQTECNYGNTPDVYSFKATYINGSDVIGIQIFNYRCSSGAIHSYEKLNESAATYQSGGVDHYIAANSDGSYNALWSTANCECSIITNISEADLKQVIDSIYK